MLDTFLAIIDRLIKLKDYRDRRLAKLFNELFAPAFDDLLFIHRDYIEMFSETESILSSVNRMALYTGRKNDYLTQMKKAAEYLRKKRIEFEPVRVKLQVLSNSMESLDLPDDAMVFVSAVQAYFPTGVLPRLGTSATELLDRIQYFSDEESVEIPDEEVLPPRYARALREYVKHLIAMHRQRWAAVCETYAALRVAAARRP